MTGSIAAPETGRYLVLLEDDAVAEGTRAMARVAGLRTVSTADAAPAAAAAELLGGVDGVVLHELGVAIVTAADDATSTPARCSVTRAPAMTAAFSRASRGR